MTEIQQTRDGVRLSGFVDARSVSDVRAAISRAIDSLDGDLRIDLSRVVAVDAVGLALIVATHRRVAAAGGRLVLDGVGPSVARLLAVTRLNRVLDVRRSETTARRESPAA